MSELKRQVIIRHIEATRVDRWVRQRLARRMAFWGVTGFAAGLLVLWGYGVL